MSETYVHGYNSRENERLQDQAGSLVDLLHSDTAYSSGGTVLEVGCGIGAQTIALARRSPGARFTSIDISAESLAEAKRRTDSSGITNVTFRQADIFDLPFDAESFDHVFVCFVLEHVSRPVEALGMLKSVVKPGGTITVIEGDHGCAYFYPRSDAADTAIESLVELQRKAGGNALIGRQLYRCWSRTSESAGHGGHSHSSCRRPSSPSSSIADLSGTWTKLRGLPPDGGCRRWLATGMKATTSPFQTALKTS